MGKGNNLIARLDKLELQVRDNEKKITKLLRVIKDNKMIEYDEFDALLQDLDTPEPKTTENTPETAVTAKTPETTLGTHQEEKAVISEPQDVTTTIAETAPDFVSAEELAEIAEIPEIVEPVFEPEPSTEELTEIAEQETQAVNPTALEDAIAELEVENGELKDKIKSLKKLQENMVVNEVVSKYEYSAEAKKFLKEHNDIEMEKRAIQERQKELKEQYKEDGVDVAATLKAQKTMIAELKEDAETAEIVEQMKAEIKADDRLMTDVTVLSQ